MSEQPTNLASDLVSLDLIQDSRRPAYEKALAQLFDAKLNAWGRLGYSLPTLGGLAMALGVGTLALTEPDTTPLATRLILGVIAIMGAFWFVICGRILLRGSVNLVGDKARLCRMALGFTTLQSLAFGWSARIEGGSLGALTLSLVFVLLAGVACVVQEVRAAELRQRERRLRDLLGDPS